jgi:SulP family sulfate permease
MINAMQFLIGCLLVGATAAVYSISFAAIIYNGELGSLLHRGIGMTLIGTAIMAASGGLFFSMSGTVSHPQDVTAVMLAASATQIAAHAQELDADALFITTAALVWVAGLAAALAAFLLGCCRLGKIVEQIPYPVMGGFLAATGYLLLTGAVSMLLDRNISQHDLLGIWNLQDLKRWLPWIAIGAVYVILARTLRADYVLPAAVVCTLIGFFILILLGPFGLEEARNAGVLLGPFPSEGLLQGYDPSLLTRINWPLIFREGPTILAISAMVALGGVLNLNGLRHLTRKDINLDNDLKTIGALNALSSMAGGLVGYPAISTSVLGWHLGLKGITAAVSAALVCLLLALFGTDVLALLPKGLFAAIISFLGIDLLYYWLWLERKRLPGWDFVIILGILIFAATIGFLEAIALGFCATQFGRYLRFRRSAKAGG